MSKGINYCQICGSKIPSERLSAHWIDIDIKCNNNDLYTCSHCGRYMEIGREIPSYCPWCGASMCGVENG